MRVVSFPEESNFTEEMRAELLLLRQQLADDLDGPDFPWARYEELHREESLHAPVTRRYLIRGNQQEQVAVAQELPQEEHKTAIPVSLPELQTPSEPTKLSIKKPVVVPSLESLCKGNEEQRKHYAAKIDSMWENVKNEIREPDYGTACTAVYKLAVWLGMVHEDTKAREWIAMLKNRYGVSITEGISKYRIKHPTSTKFKTYVLVSFKFAERNLALLAKGKPLPHRIYQ